jgi:hypothetical protein
LLATDTTVQRARLCLPRIIRLKENAPEFDNSLFNVTTGMEKRSSIGLQDALRVFRMTLRNHSQVSSISLSSPKKPNGARRAFHSAFPFKVIPEAEAFEAVFFLQHAVARWFDRYSSNRHHPITKLPVYSIEECPQSHRLRTNPGHF